MAGLGRKTFNSGDVLNAADVQGYFMDQAVMVFAGTAARGSAIPTPSAGMVAYSTATQLQVYNGSAWVDLSTGYGAATGGTSSSITVGGINYTLLTFTSSGTATITKSGLFDVLMFAGGGCGGTGATNGAVGGGGGAGGVLQSTIYLDANVTITIGAGGATGYGWTEGSSSTVGNAARNLSVAGGGKGGGYVTGSDSIQGSKGGSGGGGSGGSTAAYTKVANPSMAPGISGHSGASDNGGGGGATANASTTTGGAGYDVSAFIGGSTVTKGKGGNGNTTAGTNGAANSADGGGGGPSGNNTGYGSGGSGIVYIRFKV